MRALILPLILIFNLCRGQYADSLSESENKLIKLCDVCTCSEIPDVETSHVVFNIQCSELDRIENVPDLDKVVWPDNPNGLKISASFEGLGLSTLGKLPPNSQVESLRFSNNAIQTYWPDPFNDTPNLRRLSFYQNELTQITPDLFTNIQLLQELDLSYNKLTDFNSLDFKTLVNLKTLNLQSNQLKKIPTEALEPMTSLDDLDLSKNGIYDLLLQRSGVLKNLKRLNLSGNRIRSVFDDSFPLNNTIELLDLSNNIIEIVEKNSFVTCPNLRELNLSNNNITLVFALPPSLQIAILKVNTLYHWPDFPVGITYVDLSYNRIADMYYENQVYFDNLEVLNIGGNQIREINLEKKLPRLFSLDISYNHIEDIPSSINSQIFPNLEELRLDGNPITRIYFKNILAIRTLNMNELNNLTLVEDKAFTNVVGRSSRDDEKSCFSLYLSNCKHLSNIQDGAFDGTSLCMLDISKNNLSHLSRSLLDWASLSGGVDLQHNPWACECPLQWVVDQLLPTVYVQHSRLLADLRCGSPRALEGLRLVHWYNWTDKAMCSDYYMRDDGAYLLSPSTEKGFKFDYLTIILSVSIVIALLIAIALSVYLLKTRRRYRIRQAALRRKRQSALDAKNANGLQKEQFSALNKT